MKKVFAVLAIVLAFSSCSSESRASEAAIPSLFPVLGSTDIEPGTDKKLTVICDKDRGNLIYVATTAGGNIVTIPIAIQVMHQPESCK